MIVVSDSSAIPRMPAPTRTHSSPSEATSLRGARYRFVYCDYSSFVVDLSESLSQSEKESGRWLKCRMATRWSHRPRPTRAVAKESGQRLAVHLGRGSQLHLEVKTGTTSEELILPPSAFPGLLLRALTELGQGNAVTLTPVRAELTTQQAADLLNVSRPYLVKLLDERAVPSRKVGTHRRVLLEDLLKYKEESQARRHAALDELQALSQELGLGY